MRSEGTRRINRCFHTFRGRGLRLVTQWWCIYTWQFIEHMWMIWHEDRCRWSRTRWWWCDVRLDEFSPLALTGRFDGMPPLFFTSMGQVGHMTHCDMFGHWLVGLGHASWGDTILKHVAICYIFSLTWGSMHFICWLERHMSSSWWDTL